MNHLVVAESDCGVGTGLSPSVQSYRAHLRAFSSEMGSTADAPDSARGDTHPRL
jgi:hypothetical protein